MISNLTVIVSVILLVMKLVVMSIITMMIVVIIVSMFVNSEHYNENAVKIFQRTCITFKCKGEVGTGEVGKSSFYFSSDFL